MAGGNRIRMKRLGMLGIAILFSISHVEAQGLSAPPVQIQDVAPLLDKNMQRLRSGDIRYTVRYVPSERVLKLLQDAIRDPSTPPIKLNMLQMTATRKVAHVRLRFQGNKIRYDFSEEETDGKTTRKQSSTWAFDGKVAWIHSQQEQTGSLMKEKDAILYDDLRCPSLMFSPFVPWSSWLQTQLHNSSAQFKAEVRRVPGGWLLEIADATNYVKRLFVDPSQGYLIKRTETLVNKRLTEKDEAVEVAEVEPSVWFPTKRNTIMYDDTGTELSRKNWEVTSLRINITVPDNVFKPDFPPGTRVSDLVNNRVYVVTTPLWTFRRTLIALLVIGLLIGFWWWRYRRPLQRVTS